jgi:hypothetical protein
LLDQDVLELHLGGGPLFDENGSRVGRITWLGDRNLVIHEEHQAGAAVTVHSAVNSLRSKWHDRWSPVTGADGRHIGYVGPVRDGYACNGDTLFSGAGVTNRWRHRLVTPDGGREVAIVETLTRNPRAASANLLTRSGSRRRRIWFGSLAPPEVRGLVIAGLFLDHAARFDE